ncbi:MAG: DNA translocase FtsK 4TM domain-containing protein [Acidobacteria bacterium]|nr:DNA translocase FtsK 4TM domain-containing protein [Acidobacteriota bacterium]
MKICPKCSKTYKDDELNFCLDDGATLLKKKNGAVAEASRVNEVLAIVLLAFAVLTFLCLVSFNPSDPTFNTASSEKVQNWIGVVGANFAELLFSIAGIIAYILPALLGLIAWRVFRSAVLRPPIYRVIGFALFVFSAAGLAAMAGWHGGMIGGFAAHYATYLLSAVGATILLFASFIVSLLLITDLSFLDFSDSFRVAKENFKIHFDEWKDNREKARAEQESLAAADASLLKTRNARAGKKKDESPTVTISDPAKTKANIAETMAAAAAEAPFGPDQQASDQDQIPPTIVVPETPVKEQPDTAPAEGDIPVAPVKHTGDLTEETPPDNEEADKEDEAGETDDAIPITTGDADKFANYVLPSSQLLDPSDPPIEQKNNELQETARLLVEKTREFNVAGKVVNICPGPVVTTYEFKPDPGVKYSRVTGLVDDLCLALKAESIRIDRIPGKAYVGIEVPNQKRETIKLRDVIESKKFAESQSLLTVALGKTIDGLNYVADLAKMPHLLIAGATGAGKSVGVNSLVVSILYKAKPDEVKFIMVDPKRLELGVYADIPHLATPIITDPKRAAISLKWAVTEMERRYKDLAGYGVRNIDGYNAEAKRRNSLEQWDDNGEPHRLLPYIVIIIDELADLMMVSGKEVEESITRLAQMARAVGIHLVLATQRPSVDVITGLIKANFPSRISFRVSSKVDSRTIIDANGAEGLLGRGDMLFLPPATAQVVRVHGAYVDEKEIAAIVDQIKRQGRPEYDTTITKSEEELDDGGELPGRKDPLFWDALKCVVSAKRGSTSLLQRHLRIGYGRAAAILDAMVREGYIGDMDGSTRARPVLQKAYDDLQDLSEMEN